MERKGAQYAVEQLVESWDAPGGRGREMRRLRSRIKNLFQYQTPAMITWQYVTFVLILSGMLATATIKKRSFSDQSVKGYITERTCWWNEVCKEEFQTLFRCKCPSWSYCRSPGRYYNAVCSMTETGYIWDQPNSEWRGQ